MERPINVCPRGKDPFVIVDAMDVWVVFKPAFYSCFTSAAPSRWARAPRLQDWIVDNFANEYPFLKDGWKSNGLCQRLDVQTSGPMIVAKTPQAWGTMRNAVGRNSGDVRKEYKALMHGDVSALAPDLHKGVIEYRLQDDGEIAFVSNEGKLCRTQYEVDAVYECPRSGNRYTLLNLRLLTAGFLHQIRVHVAEWAASLSRRHRKMKFQGLLGDFKYLPKWLLQQDKSLSKRVFLHASFLEFVPPSGEKITVRCQLPSELHETLGKLRQVHPSGMRKRRRMRKY